MIVGILITQKPTPKEKVVKIGAVLPLTGAAADIGQKAKRGLEIAEKELKIKVIYEDSGSDPKQGLSAFRKLITTERDLVGVISMLSGVGNAIIPIAETEKVVTLHIASAPEMVTGKKFSFRWYITSKEQMKAVVKYLHQQNVSEKSRIAFLFINDEYGRGALKEFTESFKEQFGVEPNLVSEAYEKEQTDFKNILVKLKTFNPEILAIVGYNKSLGILLKQMREQKIEPRILTGDDAISYPEILQVAGNAADGFVFPGLPLEPKEGEQVSQFFQIYKEQFNEPVSDFALFAYGMAHMFYHCVINGAKTSEEIANCLETNVFSTPIGEVSFNRETHDGNVPLRMKEIKGGEVIEHK
ncbi:MAG: ABC transporter substrate-binding protein [Candidatus Hydrothermales bacterium]